MSRILDRYPRAGRTSRLYRRLRLRFGGLRRLAALLPERGLIVDLGCGEGLLAHLLLEDHAGRRVLAVDHDEERIRALSHSVEGLPIEVRPGDMASVGIPSCAGVALVDVLHYLDTEPQEALLTRAAEALESGGVLVLRDPDRSAFLRYALARTHEAIAIATGLTRARQGRYRMGREWLELVERRGLVGELLPLPWFSPYADRIVVGRKP